MECNEHWPICLYDVTFKQKYALYFAFREAKKPHIIENYFSSEPIRHSTMINDSIATDIHEDNGCGYYNEDLIQQCHVDVGMYD